jgi:hypothetical protein
MLNARRRILDTDDLEVPVTLAGQELFLRFVERHLEDLRTVIEVDSILQQ